jgi:hypothetical protein
LVEKSKQLLKQETRFSNTNNISDGQMMIIFINHNCNNNNIDYNKDDSIMNMKKITIIFTIVQAGEMVSHFWNTTNDN